MEKEWYKKEARDDQEESSDRLDARHSSVLYSSLFSNPCVKATPTAIEPRMKTPRDSLQEPWFLEEKRQWEKIFDFAKTYSS